MNALAWLIFIVAALFEVGGDAAIRKGLRGRGVGLILLGVVMLGTYGIVVNAVRWNFSRLLGVYVAVFAVTSILFGKFVFGDQVSLSTWLGVVIVILGGLVIQFGAA